MNQQLLLKNIRTVLVRLEETIIFSLLERSQFKLNAMVYESQAFAEVFADRSLALHLLHETEKVHARMRRYTSPDEHPFFNDLPAPVLTLLSYGENPLHDNDVNLNQRIYREYVERLLPRLCAPGDDGQYGSTAVCDVACLQALSKRIHYGKFVAESKYREAPEGYRRLIAAGDRPGIVRQITETEVEEQLFTRVRVKAASYSSMLPSEGLAEVFPQTALAIYRDLIVPLTKEVEIGYLLQR